MVTKQVGLRQTQSSAFQFDSKDIDVGKLLLDPNNYRFLDVKKFKKRVSTRFHEESVQQATLAMLERSYQLDELKESILANGYVPMERIIVSPHCCPATSRTDSIGCKYLLSRYRSPSLEVPVKWAFSRTELG